LSAAILARAANPALRPLGVALVALAAGAAAGAAANTKALPLLLAVAGVPTLVAVAMRSRRDAVTVAGVFLLTLLAIPSRFAIGAISAQLTPAIVVGLLALWIWMFFRLVPAFGVAPGPQPIRWAMFVLLWTTGASFASAFVRPLSATELRAAYIGLIIIASSAGIALLIADGIRDQSRLETLLRLMVAGICGLALLGIFEFATGIDITASLSLPGLSASDDAGVIDFRSAVRRVQATAAHPIELAVVMAMAVPLALHFARWATSYGVSRLWAWSSVVILLVAIPMTVSRAGILGLAVGGLIVVPTWKRAEQVIAVAGLAFVALALRAAAPGLLGTLVALFTYLGVDPSALHRSDDYAVAAQFVPQSPLFGRGFHTFIPTLANFHGLVDAGYPFVDNQYVMTIIEGGVVGLVVLVLIFAVGAGLAAHTRHLAAGDDRTRDLAWSLMASLLTAAAAFIAFDGLAFAMVRGAVFVVLGCIGALWRLESCGRPSVSRLLRVSR
jgi:polysaccharide biosynthesis protein PslJ